MKQTETSWVGVLANSYCKSGYQSFVPTGSYPASAPVSRPVWSAYRSSHENDENHENNENDEDNSDS